MNQFQRMSFNKELENELVDLAAAVNTNIRQVEDGLVLDFSEQAGQRCG